jgi:protein-S-isoprenylcysteine O-methyltransferase Ste14
VKALLYRFRGEFLVLWGLASLLWILPSQGWIPSIIPLLTGLALRAWARRFIGAHSRGRILACPERVAGGPYRWLSHPLYLANVLVLSGLASCLIGPHPLRITLALSGPTLLYLVLAREESKLLALANPPSRTSPLDASSGKWRSEWASFLPPFLLWFLAAR